MQQVTVTVGYTTVLVLVYPATIPELGLTAGYLAVPAGRSPTSRFARFAPTADQAILEVTELLKIAAANDA